MMEHVLSQGIVGLFCFAVACIVSAWMVLRSALARTRPPVWASCLLWFAIIILFARGLVAARGEYAGDASVRIAESVGVVGLAGFAWRWLVHGAVRFLQFGAALSTVVLVVDGFRRKEHHGKSFGLAAVFALAIPVASILEPPCVNLTLGLAKQDGVKFIDGRPFAPAAIISNSDTGLPARVTALLERHGIQSSVDQHSSSPTCIFSIWAPVPAKERAVSLIVGYAGMFDDRIHTDGRWRIEGHEADFNRGNYARHAEVGQLLASIRAGLTPRFSCTNSLDGDFAAPCLLVDISEKVLHFQVSAAVSPDMPVPTSFGHYRWIGAAGRSLTPVSMEELRDVKAVLLFRSEFGSYQWTTVPADRFGRPLFEPSGPGLPGIEEISMECSVFSWPAGDLVAAHRAVSTGKILTPGYRGAREYMAEWMDARCTNFKKWGLDVDRIFEVEPPRLLWARGGRLEEWHEGNSSEKQSKK